MPKMVIFTIFFAVKSYNHLILTPQYPVPPIWTVLGGKLVEKMLAKVKISKKTPKNGVFGLKMA